MSTSPQIHRGGGRAPRLAAAAVLRVSPPRRHRHRGGGAEGTEAAAGDATGVRPALLGTDLGGDGPGALAVGNEMMN